MKKPKLVVMSGYPSSGKTTIAEYLEKEFGFSYIGSDDLRKKLYGKGFPELEREKELDMWDILYCLKTARLYDGLDVVIDSTAPTNEYRKSLLDTKIPAEKYLLVLDVDRPVLESRERKRRGDIKAILQWDTFWDNPEPSQSDYEVLLYKNNTPEDRDDIYSNLKFRFRGETEKDILPPRRGVIRK